MQMRVIRCGERAAPRYANTQMLVCQHIGHTRLVAFRSLLKVHQSTLVHAHFKKHELVFL